MDIEKKIIVGPTDTDSYNIIHHPQYFIWVEEAILEWLILTYGSMDGLSYEVNQFHCKFISPGLLYHPLLLRLIPKNRKRNLPEESVKFQVRIMNEKTKASVIEADFFVTIKGSAQ